ncbi:gluconate:H+ symporter [Mucilaginibacter sp. Bleaf8]|uniref:GntT/GntP/DsdX family permease n=1 Tax=Mucilaginibacter sp. Bleaf8 TaxID=2834430 RepID=UPI001BCF8106|nr:gluconate:H+ symporter [Mucilaginibacter sp. Bleaf8]MBS7566891.1 gluconate:H+ symporter [Mucilaginibacter sp. Bleaf8]
MVLFTVLFSILLLIALVSWGKVTPFVAFLIVSIAAGLLLQIPPVKILASIQKGLGDTLGSLVIIVCLGAMLGKLVAVSGAAQKIASVLVNAVGKKYLQWALVATGFIVGIPLFYGIGFVLLVPLIFSIVYRYKLPAVYIGLPMLASLSVTHGFLPPHPSPAALVVQFHGNMGVTLIYGLAVAIPAIIVAGPLFARTLKNIKSDPLATFKPEDIPQQALPGAFNSFVTALLPVILLMFTSLLPYACKLPPVITGWLAFVGDPSMVMLIALAVGTYTLGIKQGKTMSRLSSIYVDAVKDIVLVLLIIGGSGAFKQVLMDSGISTEIARQLEHVNVHPLVLGWLIAAMIRVSLGSATVAGLTAAGIMVSVAMQNHVNPNLMVLSIGAGSLAFSHVNDSGFWLFKEYFNLSIKDTFRSWSVMESIIAVMGLAGVMLLNAFVVG